MATTGNQHVVLFHNKDTFIFLNESLKKFVIIKNVESSANFVANGRWKIFEGYDFFYRINIEARDKTIDCCVAVNY